LRSGCRGRGAVSPPSCDRDRPFARVDRTGLLWLLNGDKLVALTESAVTIARRTGARQTHRRKPSGPGHLLAWADTISREQAEKYYPAARLPALEQSPADDGHLIGRDPRRMSVAELAAIGHQAQPLLGVIRAKGLDCIGYERARCENASPLIALSDLSHGAQPFPRDQPGAARSADCLRADRREDRRQKAPQNPEAPETAEGEMA